MNVFEYEVKQKVKVPTAQTPDLKEQELLG